MSFTPCNRCGEPLLAYPGSACTNAECKNAALPDDPNPYAKTRDGSDYFTSRKQPLRREEQRPMRRAFKGIR